ncbi:hypothetical protein JHK87_027891 [Glycine soja]|nr:hypothetical protein JHK87_027891 [Glycine soja]
MNEFFINKGTNTLGLVLSVWSGVRDISRSKLTHMILAPNDDNDNHDASGSWKKTLQGDFLKAFSRRLGHCTILKAKLWAILFGMNMAYDSGYKAIIIETDYVEAVELAEDPRYHEDQFVDLSYEIVKTKEKFTSCSIVHVLRQTNTMADCFAKNGLTIDRDVCFYDSLLDFTVTSMRMDENLDPSILSNI